MRLEAAIQGDLERHMKAEVKAAGSAVVVNGGVKLDHQGGVNLDHLGRCEARCFRLSR
jgi:hypothetical protein